MVLDTHSFGSSRYNHCALRDFSTFALTFAAYVKEMTSRFALVMAAYADPAHPGSLRSDLIQAGFMQGIDQAYYARHTDHIMNALPLSTCVEAIAFIQ